MKKHKIMKSIKIFVSFLLAIFTLNSCEKEIQFNGEITEPLIVVNSYITPDSIITAQLSESRFFLKSETTFNNIENADLSLFVNGTFLEKMLHTNNGIYISTYKPGVGDTIRMEVQVLAKAEVSCQTTLESQTEIIKVDTTSSPASDGDQTSGILYPDNSMYSSSNRTLKFSLKFSDKAAEQNFYRLVVTTRTYFVNDYHDDYYFSFDDIVSGNSNENSIGPPTSLSSNTYNIFSDDLFNGKQYSLKFSIIEYNDYYGEGQTNIKKEVYINLQSINKDYYLYLKSRDANENSDDFFSEPIQIFSNVEGGIGILGSYTSSIKKIDL